MFHATGSRATLRQAVLSTIQQLERRLMLTASAGVEDREFLVGITWGDTDAHAYRIELVPDDPTRIRALADGVLLGEAALDEFKIIYVYLSPGDDRVEFGDGIRKPVEIWDDGGNDTIIGGDGDEELDGGWGDDVIIGNGGDDEIWGGPGNDVIRGGAGNDLLFGSAYQTGADEPDRDHVDGGPGNDRLEGNWDDDTLVGDQGRDTARGGTGRDTLIGVSESFSLIEDRTWEINGDQDADRPDDRITIDVDPKNKGVLRATVNGKVLGRVKASRIRSVHISSGNGDDVVRVDLPKSLAHLQMAVWGGDGDDRLYGSHTDDGFSGEKGDDTIDGGAGGDDDLWGDEGDDVVTPLDAEYTYSDNPAGGRYYADDRFWDIYLHVTPESNGTGQTVLVRVAPDDAGVLQLVAGGKVLSTAPADEVQAIFVNGGPFDDHITLRLPDDYQEQVDVYGMDGDDTIIGGRGDQLLVGGYGDDVIVGGADADSLVGAAGDDVLKGGGGDDLATGGKGDDTLLGGKGDDELAGGGGDDRLDGQAGVDALRGGAGEDSVTGGEPAGGAPGGGESKKAKRRVADEVLGVRDPLASK